ncbi:MAG: hypothetical protein WB507_08715 [Solirubrobacterales bacterium]
MASWPQLKQYIEDNYVVRRDVGEGLQLEFGSDQEDGRTQMVFVTHLQREGGEDWVSIESPVGKADEIDLARALAAAGDVVCGGLASWAVDPTLLVMKHGIPIGNLDSNEFEVPIQFLAGTADRLEKMLTGEDRL